MAENTRLTDLTRMLLGSSAFSAFLNEMSGSDGQVGTSSTESRQQVPAPNIEGSQSDPPKDVNPHQPSHQSQSERGDAQVGMVFMPEQYTNLGTANIAWADNADFGLYDAQVYAVTSMPEGPADDQLDTGLLFGKSTDVSSPIIGDQGKQDTPVIEFLSPPSEDSKGHLAITSQSDAVRSPLEQSDPAFALYDDPSTSRESASTQQEDIVCRNVHPEKTIQRTELTLVGYDSETGEVSASAMRRFVQFCAKMEAPSQRVASIISHLR